MKTKFLFSALFFWGGTALSCPAAFDGGVNEVQTFDEWYAENKEFIQNAKLRYGPTIFQARNTSLSHWLRSEMEKRGVALERLALASKLDFLKVESFVSGETLPAFSELIAMAEVLEVTDVEAGMLLAYHHFFVTIPQEPIPFREDLYRPDRPDPAQMIRIEALINQVSQGMMFGSSRPRRGTKTLDRHIDSIHAWVRQQREKWDADTRWGSKPMQLSKLLEVDSSVWAKIESGEIVPPELLLVKIAMNTRTPIEEPLMILTYQFRRLR